MTDSVTLYRLDDDGPKTFVDWDSSGKQIFDGRAVPVGEFVSRPWCKTHDCGSKEKNKMCFAALVLGSDDCELVDVLVQVIPDDPKEI